MNAILYKKEQEVEEKCRETAIIIKLKNKTIPDQQKRIKKSQKLLNRIRNIQVKLKIKDSKRSKQLDKLIDKSKFNAKYFEELKSINSVKQYDNMNKFIPY
ncbi:MAG: hypothetical protein EU541_04950 [Promethearchaeota archaeon]|nr:MAG: hypothetical protein EU541_04950 [Candidatus Lokiarchaeota archaeon]